MKAEAVLEILDEVNVRLRKLDAGTMARCSARLAYYSENYRFSPRFVLKRWDGKIRLLKDTGYTLLNLLDEILPDIETNYDLIIEDRRKDYSGLVQQVEFVTEDMFSHLRWPTGHDQAGKPILLRDYQVEAANACIRAGSGVMELGTSGGKSLLCAALSARYLPVGNVVVVVPSIDLVIQTRATFRVAGIDCGIWYGMEKDRKPVTMATWQSLDHFEELFQDTTTFIIDEVQGAAAKILNDMLAGPAAKIPFRFGCTGTLPKNMLARQQIRGVVGPTVFTKSIKAMQDEGYLAQGEIEQIMLLDRKNPLYVRAVGGTEAKDGHREYLDEIEWMYRDTKRMEWIINLLGALSNEGKTLVLVQHIPYHQRLTEALPQAISINGLMPPRKREPLWESFRGPENLAIVTSGVGSVGIDVPEIRHVVGIEMGKSLIKTLQTLGRGLRKTSTKNWLDFIDLHGNAKLSLRHANERRKIFEQAGQTVIRTEVDYT